MRGAQSRLEVSQQRSAWLAWHVAALPKLKTFPSLEKFVTGNAAKVEPQSPEILQAMCEALSRAWGAEVT